MLNGMQIILLDGVSCAGKSSIARELARQNPRPTIFSFDDYFRDGNKSQHSYRKYYSKKDLPWRADMIDKFHIKIYNEVFLANMLRTKSTIIIDHSLKTADMFENLLFWLRAIESDKIKLVKIVCSLETALKRCQERNESSDSNEHRVQGEVKNNFLPERYNQQYNKVYDVEINTDTISPQAAAQSIQEFSTPTRSWQKNFTNHEETINDQYEIYFSPPSGTLPIE